MERRKRQRLAGFDYAQAGTHFITINTADRACLFGHIANGDMHLNALGDAVASCWRDLPRAMRSIVLHEWVLMVDLDRIRKYIVSNPARWDRDENNPARWQG
jgi:REP element-mobilizing transposase RayT